MAFFVSRYFRLRSYAEIYATMFAIFSIGTGFGPYLAGISFDLRHSCNPIFLLFEIVFGVTCILFRRLRSYPFPAEGSDPFPVVGSVRRPISKPA